MHFERTEQTPIDIFLLHHLGLPRSRRSLLFDPLRRILDANFSKENKMPDTKKLLVVDDEDTLRTLVKYELEQRGYSVSEAESGETAMEKLRSDHFDLVILDIRMPGMDGMEVLKNIREENLADKVIMLTGVGEMKIARDSLQLGANDFLTKPYELKTLLACMDRVQKE
jgi:DNA-binding response OmpR family regulator